MKRFVQRFLIALLAVLLLSECTDRLDAFLEEDTPAETYAAVSAQEGDFIPYSAMQYQRPDLDELRSLLDDVAALAEGGDTDRILKGVFAFYDAYDWFYTCYSLADIRYSADLTDSYWEKENSFCTSAASTVNQMLDELNVTLAASPARKKLEEKFFGNGFFDDYDGEGFWDEKLVTLMERESELVSQYYSQSREADSLFSGLLGTNKKMVQTLVDLIRVRHEIADHLGYETYEQFANDYYFYRDYEPEEMSAYLDGIRTELVPLYRRIWDMDYDLPDTKVRESLDYVRNAAKRMGGKVWDAFCLMEQAGLYDIEYSDKKYNSSFEVYLESYAEPFLFMNPEQTAADHLVLAHEFGHFCNDYASGGSQVGIDVNEVFSQGMEYLSLCCTENAQELTRVKLTDSLQTYVEQAAYARFEQEMYRIPRDQLSVSALCDLYERIAREYGFDSVGYEKDEFVSINHLYTNPFYVSSYIISNDAALELYQMETAKAGSGLKCYLDNLDTKEYYFLDFLKSAGLESPFAEGRLKSVRKMFSAALF